MLIFRQDFLSKIPPAYSLNVVVHSGEEAKSIFSQKRSEVVRLGAFSSVSGSVSWFISFVRKNAEKWL